MRAWLRHLCDAHSLSYAKEILCLLCAATLTILACPSTCRWGGHYPVVGGGVNGGQIVGQYWSDMSNAAPLNLGRGRMIPSMSWDAQWHGITQWMGVADEKLLEVLPNKGNFDVAMLLNRTQMFTN